MSEDTITFGTADSWSYNRITKTYDLTRGSSKKLSIATTEGYGDTFFAIDPEKSALVIVDMQNFFLNPKCMVHPLGMKAVEPTIAAIKKCREAGIQVIWLNWGLTDEDIAKMPAGVLHGFSKELIDTSHPKKYAGLGADMGEGMGRALFEGSWNAGIYPDLQQYVDLADIHCAKNRMSGLWSQDQPLWKYLKSAGKKTLLFTGVNTDQCVLGTLTNAYNAGWDVVMVEDCCATTTAGAKEVCMWNISRNYGFVCDSKALVEGKLE